jgi:hypothetical protein
MGCASHPLGGCLCWQNQGNATATNTPAYQLDYQNIGAAVCSCPPRVAALELEVKSLRALVNEIKNRVL